MTLREKKTLEERKKYVEQEIGVSLIALSCGVADYMPASLTNCEQMIGVVRTPLGVAGPLHIKYNKNEYQRYIPLATTEGALIASVQRGMKAIALSGGSVIHVERIGVTRAPVFLTKNVTESLEIKSWIAREHKKLAQVAEATSTHLKYLGASVHMVGKRLYVRFRFDTGEAMGMNMATIATSALVSYIEKKWSVVCTALSSNRCVDKKPSASALLEGRGRKIYAEAYISDAVLKDVCKTTKEKLVQTWVDKCAIGSAIAGTIGNNVHQSNILAAIFLATGQDLGHIAECSSGIITTDREAHGVRISVMMPDLMVGTIGGGTYLPTQQECLSLMQLGVCKTGEQTDFFAALIGGAVLAGEISLLSSLAEGSLACAHQRLARKK